MASGLWQRLHVNTCGGRGAAVLRALPWPRPVVGRDATVEVSEGRPPAVVATDMAVPPRTEATGRLPPPVDGMRALDAMPLLDSKILTIRESPGRIPTDFSAESPLIVFPTGWKAEPSPHRRLYDAPIAGLSSAASGTEGGRRTGTHGSVPPVGL